MVAEIVLGFTAIRTLLTFRHKRHTDTIFQKSAKGSRIKFGVLPTARDRSQPIISSFTNSSIQYYSLHDVGRNHKLFSKQTVVSQHKLCLTELLGCDIERSSRWHKTQLGYFSSVASKMKHRVVVTRPRGRANLQRPWGAYRGNKCSIRNQGGDRDT